MYGVGTPFDDDVGLALLLLRASQPVHDHVRRDSRCLIVHHGFVVVEVCPFLEGGRGDEPGGGKEKRGKTLVKSRTQRV